MEYLGPKMGKPLRSGFMLKRGKLHRNFKRRFFILQADSLYYFKKKGSSKPAGVIPLVNARLETQGLKDGAFHIVTNKRTYVLECAFEFERAGWLRELRARIGISKSFYKHGPVATAAAAGEDGAADSDDAGEAKAAVDTLHELGVTKVDDDVDEADEDSRSFPAASTIGPLVEPEKRMPSKSLSCDGADAGPLPVVPPACCSRRCVPCRAV